MRDILWTFIAIGFKIFCISFKISVLLLLRDVKRPLRITLEALEKLFEELISAGLHAKLTYSIIQRQRLCLSYVKAEVRKIFNTEKLNSLQKIQNRAARITTNSPYDASAAPLLQNLGWPSIKVVQEISAGFCHNCALLDTSMRLGTDIEPCLLIKF